MTARADHAPLREAWLQLMDAMGVAAQSAHGAYAQIAARYAESHRAYHTLVHVGQVLQDVRRLSQHTRDLHQVQVAAWLHDVIYDPHAADNEEQSAAYAAELLQALDQPPLFISGVQRLIRLTAHHQTAEDDGDGHVLLDADLAVLGAPAVAYARYAVAIRREYAWVDEAPYRAGRVAVLRRFLQRPAIYHTPLMRREREQKARHNIQAEIDRLRPAPSSP